MTDDPTGLLREASEPGTVVYGILSWRSDSIMMRRLLPVFTDLMIDAGRAVCVDVTDPCRVHWPDERHRWCEGCCLLDIADRVEEVARP